MMFPKYAHEKNILLKNIKFFLEKLLKRKFPKNLRILKEKSQIKSDFNNFVRKMLEFFQICGYFTFCDCD